MRVVIVNFMVNHFLVVLVVLAVRRCAIKLQKNWVNFWELLRVLCKSEIDILCTKVFNKDVQDLSIS